MTLNLETILTQINTRLAKTRLRPLTRYLNRELVSYLIVGGLTTVVGLGSYWLALRLGTGVALANTISTWLAILFAYVTNKLLVFQSSSWRLGLLLPELAKFGASRALTWVVETVVLVLLVDVWGLHDMLMKLCTMVVIQVLGNYALSKWVVFTRK